MYYMLHTTKMDHITTIDDLCEGATIYHLAVENNDHALIKKASKTELETIDKDGESVLHYAAVNNDLETCKLLLKLNPSLKDIKCFEGKTALEWAKLYNDEYKTHQPVCDFLENEEEDEEDADEEDHEEDLCSLKDCIRCREDIARMLMEVEILGAEAEADAEADAEAEAEAEADAEAETEEYARTLTALLASFETSLPE
jgi:hypothetical protein